MKFLRLLPELLLDVLCPTVAERRQVPLPSGTEALNPAVVAGHLRSLLDPVGRHHRHGVPVAGGRIDPEQNIWIPDDVAAFMLVGMHDRDDVRLDDLDVQGHVPLRGQSPVPFQLDLKLRTELGDHCSHLV